MSRNWNLSSDDLSARLAAVSVASPSTSGGGVRQDTAVVQGESVIVVTQSLLPSSSSLCGAVIGSGKICFRWGCGIVSHAKNRPSDPVGPGIYVRCTLIGPNHDRVLQSPVGDVSLLDVHRTAILTEKDVTPNNWVSKFNTWSKAATVEEAAEVETFKDLAREAQTPAKRKTTIEQITSLIDQDPMEILGMDMDAALTLYEDVWNAAAQAANIKKEETHHLKELLLSTTSRLDSLTSAVKGLSAEMSGIERWATDGVDQASLRVTELEQRLGAPTGTHPTVWSAIDTLTQDHVLAKAASDTKFSDVDNEFNQMFTGVTAFQNKVNSSIASLSAQAPTAPTNAPSGAPSTSAPSNAPDPLVAAMNATMEALKADLDQLQLERAADRARIESLESRLETGTDQVEVQTPSGKSMLLRSSVDVLAFLQTIGALDLDFGGFADVYNYFLRIHAKCVGEGDLERVVKLKKDVQSLKISENEAFAIHTHSSILPAIFSSGKATEKSEIGPLQTFKAWRIKGTQFGMAYNIEKYLPLVEKDIRAVIDHEYGNYPELKNKAREMSMESKAFISALISWVDDTHTELTDAGNPAEDVWWIITRVLRAIFEEYFAPARLTSTKTKFASHGHQAATLIWGSMRCHLATVDLVSKGLRDHPIVVGSYAKWLVSNSGRKEALAAQKEVTKVQASLTSLRSSAQSDIDKCKSACQDLRSKVETVKKTADKALAKAAEAK